MEIGRITEEDLPALAELYQQLLPNEPSHEKMINALMAVERNPNQIILGASIDGKLVGTVMGMAVQMLFGQCRSFMVVEDVVVDTEHRRMGVGSALMRELERFAFERNCSYILLITDTDREDAQGLYTSLGYQTDSYKAFKKAL